MKKRLISILLVVGMVMSMLPLQAIAAECSVESAGEIENPFSDVQKSDWYYDSVMYTLQNGLFTGVSGTEFQPGGVMTRAMYVTVMGRIAKINADDFQGETGFSDVPQKNWAAPYILWAKENGITGGTGSGRFSPDGFVTREQMAALSVRFLEKYEIPFPDKTTDTRPKDIDSVSAYAKDAVLKLWSCGLFQGDTAGNFNPQKNASRAEAAAFCQRTDETVEKWYLKEGKKEDANQNYKGNVTYYTFKFDSGDGTSVSDRSIEEGRRLDNLPVPYKADAIFVGWCYDKALTRLVETSDTAKASCILYAKYEEMTPLNENESTPVAIALDSKPDFSVQIASEEALSLEELQARIKAKNLSSNEDRAWFKITQSGNVFTVSGYHYLGEGGARQEGFVPGSAYKITLEDEGLSFVGQDESTRVYDFTIQREEVVNVGLNENVKKISISDIRDLTVNGEPAGTVSIPVITLGTDGAPADTGVTTGSFIYEKGSLAVGNTVLIYEGSEAPTLDMDSAVSTDSNAFVEIVEKNGSSYAYKTARAENVLFTPDVLPLSETADIDGNPDDFSVTVPVAVMTYTDDRYALAGLDSRTTMDKGDFIAFYSGTLKDDGTIEGGRTERYGEIQSVETVGDNYVITYQTVTLSELQAAMAANKKENMDGDALLEGVDREEIERSVEQQARDSGFADEAGMYLAALALETDSFTQISGEYGLKSVRMQLSGEPITQETLRLMGADKKVEVELSKLQATLGTDLVHFEDLSGLRLTLDIGITITIHAEKADIEIEVTGSFEQEVRVALGVDGDAVWKWWGIFPYIAEYKVTAFAEFYTYTGIGVEATIATKEKDDEDGFGTKNESIEEIGKQIKDLMDKKDKYIGDGSETLGDSLEEKYSDMLENESDWVELFEKTIARQDTWVLLIINITFEVQFVVSANMNISLGLDFWYENAKRYIYTVEVFSQRVSNETIDLVEEHYEFEFYVMGTMGLRAGIKLELKIGIFSTDLASVGFGAEAGAYVRIWGYFYYQLSYHANASPQKTTSYSGALLFELGVYLEITFEAQALKGTFSYNPTLYENEWPLWSAGSRENVRDFAYESEDTPEIMLKQYIQTIQIPDGIFEMAYLDLKDGLNDGELFTAVFDSEGRKGALTDDDMENDDDEANFKISMTNPAFSYNPKTNQITVHPGDAVRQEGEMVVTWINQPLAFSSAPLERRITLYWDNLRDGYVIVPHTNGGSYLPIMVNKSGEKVFAPENPTKKGYVFAGWFQNEALTQAYAFPELMPDSDTKIYAKWTPASDTAYTVNHYRQILGSSQYALADADKLKGTTDSKVTPPTKTYAGYKTPERKELTIQADGSAVLNYYYDLQTHTVTFKPGEVGGDDEVISLKYSAVITAPQFAARGYTFVGWDRPVSGCMGEQDLVYTAQWEKDSATEYRVEYYVQQPDGRFMLRNLETRAGKTGERIEVSALRRDSTYEEAGVTAFKSITVNGARVDNAVITGDGKTVIKVNYERSRYTVTFQPENGAGDIVYTLYSGAKIEPPSVSKLGYDFRSWGGVAESLGTENLTYTALWSARTDTGYTVRHIREDLKGGYPNEGDLVDIEQRDDGVTAAETVAEARVYAGFTAQSFAQETIAPDGSTVVEIRYSRNSYPINWVVDGETTTEQVKYGAEIVTPQPPAKQGYIFERWIGFAEGMTMGTDGQTFTARWKPAPDTRYTVKHILQDLDESYPVGGDLVKNEVKTGATGSQTAAAPKDCEGFTPETITQAEILPDGSTVVEIRYSRNSYHITWSANGEVFDTTGEKYGATITMPDQTPGGRAGYTFAAWQGVPETMPAQDKTFEALWTANTYEVSFDSGGGSEAGPVMVTYDSSYGELPVPTLDGYIFTGWVSAENIPVTAETTVKTAGDHVLTATWAANDATRYTVRHYQQNVVGDEYTQIGRDEVKYGETDTETAAAANHYEGFTPLDFEQVTIAGDGLAVVDIYYDRNVHTVTWEINGEHTAQTCRYGAAIAAPGAERTGYVFQGWNVAPEKTMPDRDLSYTAQWTARSFAVKFDSRGGSRVEGISVTYDGVYPALAEPTRTGYTFAGWFCGSTQIREGDIVAVTADTTLAARWTANRYAVSFALNGGAGTTPGGITVTYDGTYSKLPENTAVKMGHSFDGWYTAENGGAKVGPSTTVKTAGDHTLYAHWKLNAYTITLDENGGSALSDITADYGATVTLPTAEMKGHTFAGWKLDETTTYRAGAQITMPEDGLTLTAQWSVNQYTVTFDSAGGTDVGSVRVDYGQTVPAPAVPEKNGYTFVGWQKDGEGFSFDTPITDHTVLTASWAATAYAITYLHMDGVSHSNPASYTIESAAIALSAAFREGYDFGGWYTREDFAETSRVAGIAIAHGSTGAKTFYAKWTAITFGVNFNDNTQSNKTASQSFTYDRSQALMSNPFTNPGYTFEGWNTAADGAGTSYSDGETVRNLVGVTLYAQWEPIAYSISYTLGAGGVGGNNPTSYTVETGDVVLNAPSTIHAGYQFLGWFSGDTQIKAITKGSTGNVELTAKWGHSGVFSLSYVGTSGSTSTYRITRTIPAGAVPNPNPQYVYYRTVNGTAIGGTAEAVHFNHVGGENVYKTFTSADGSGSYQDFTVTGENAYPTDYQHTGGVNCVAVGYTDGVSRYYSVELYKVVDTVNSAFAGAIDADKRSYQRTLAQGRTNIVPAEFYSAAALEADDPGDRRIDKWQYDWDKNKVNWLGEHIFSLSRFQHNGQAFTSLSSYFEHTSAQISVTFSANFREYYDCYMHINFTEIGSAERFDWSGDQRHTLQKTYPANAGAITVKYGISGANDNGYVVSAPQAVLSVADTKEPTQIGLAPMAEGQYRRGDTITLSVVYDEIVANRNNADLGSIRGLNLANMTYRGGEGTNVLTYTATVNQDSYEVDNSALMAQKPIWQTVYDMAS